MANRGTSECAEEDNLVRHVARKMPLKEFGLLKACTEVLDRMMNGGKKYQLK